jgi:hypothetical protein
MSLNFVGIPYPSSQVFTVCLFEAAERCPVLGIADSTFVDKRFSVNCTKCPLKIFFFKKSSHAWRESSMQFLFHNVLQGLVQ